MGCSCNGQCGSNQNSGYDGAWYGHPPLRNALIGGLIAGLGFGLVHLGTTAGNIANLFYLVAISIGAYHWAREGIEDLVREHELGTDILMIAATAGSIALGLWDEAAFLAVLYGAAEGIEDLTTARTRASIHALMDLAPKKAVLIRDGKDLVIPAEDLKPGDIFLVKPGASIPTDGIIVRGQSGVNEAAVTGESMPVEKQEGMKVYAATLNIDGALQVRATASFKDNSLTKIIHLVEEAQERKGKTQLFIERFGRKYTPLVLLSSFLLIVIPPLFGLPFGDLAVRGVVLLVAAAPCALVMSTPVAVAAGIGSAGRSGVLVKGGAYLESLGKVRAVAFDKTGTLTSGTPAVTDVVLLDGGERELLAVACTVERCSDHPLARAVVKHAEVAGIRPYDAAASCVLMGQGASAVISGTVYYVTKPEFFAASDSPLIGRLRSQGKTVVAVGTQEHVLGLIAVRDRVRENAKAMVKQLHGMGIATVMLTGDNQATARAVAAELGIDMVRADLKPEDKTAAIEVLKEQYGAVAMIGDGINDVPALASATVGVAMGAIGTNAAIEAADVALMADDLAKVPEAIEFGRKTLRVGRQNIVFSLATLAIMIPAALTGFLTVAAAVIFHEASELLAVGNGLRLVKK